MYHLTAYNGSCSISYQQFSKAVSPFLTAVGIWTRTSRRPEQIPDDNEKEYEYFSSDRLDFIVDYRAALFDAVQIPRVRRANPIASSIRERTWTLTFLRRWNRAKDGMGSGMSEVSLKFELGVSTNGISRVIRSTRSSVGTGRREAINARRLDRVSEHLPRRNVRTLATAVVKARYDYLKDFVNYFSPPRYFLLDSMPVLCSFCFRPWNSYNLEIFQNVD